jgi:DNA primase
LDLRELQKTGRLGRIDVELNAKENKTLGTISIPTGLDQATTSLLAAAIESIERVGPYNCNVQLTSIEDIREKRRKQIIDRAKHILQRWSADTRSGSAEAIKEITDVARIRDIVSYGPENVPAGPEAASSSELIIVEGRADIALLLRTGYRNCIAVNGVTVPKSVVDLTLKKDKVTALVDGDRVGDMILRELARIGKVDFVAKAPPGREVEELSPSELIDLLGKRVPLADYMAKIGQRAPEAREAQPEAREAQPEARQAQAVARERPRAPAETPRAISNDVREKLKPYVEAVQGKLTAYILGEKGEVLAEVPTIQLADKLKEIDAFSFVVVDGIVTQRIVDMMQSKKANLIVGERIGELERRPAGISVMTLRDILA